MILLFLGLIQMYRSAKVAMTPEHDSRLQNAEAMESFFLGKSLLLPSPSDLSYYNHYTQHASYLSSPTFEVSA